MHPLPPRTALSLSLAHTQADPVLAALFFHEHVVSEVCRLALEHYTIYSYTPAFPELCVVAKVVLKQFTKQTKMHKLKRFVEVLVARLDANANFVNVQRNLLALNPREVSECFSIRDYISRSMGMCVCACVCVCVCGGGGGI
jgi:hypothetical protein